MSNRPNSRSICGTCEILIQAKHSRDTTLVTHDANVQALECKMFASGKPLAGTRFLQRESFRLILLKIKLAQLSFALDAPGRNAVAAHFFVLFT